MPVWQATAAFRMAMASVAPEASPRRMPRSSSGALADPLEQPAMAGLGRDMRDEAMVERVRVGGVQHRRRGGRGEAVEQHRHARHARRHDRAGDRRELVPAEPAQHVERIAGAAAVAARRAAATTALLSSSAAPATPVPGPVQSAALAAEQRAGTAPPPTVVLAMPISPSASSVDAGLDRHHAVGHRRARIPPRSSPAPSAKSAVGWSRFIS